MNLEKNEYTTESMIKLLSKKFGQKVSGEPFNKNDIAQYIKRGMTPYRYGAMKLKAKKESGVRIITVG